MKKVTSYQHSSAEQAGDRIWSIRPDGGLCAKALELLGLFLGWLRPIMTGQASSWLPFQRQSIRITTPSRMRIS